MIRAKIYKKSNIVNVFAVFTVILAIAAYFFVTLASAQSVSTASQSDLQVPPPGYANFDSSLTQAALDFIEQPAFKAFREKSAESMSAQGFSWESMKFYIFTTDRPLEEVFQYYLQKVGPKGHAGGDPMIEKNPVIDPPEEMEEAEKMTGVSFEAGFMDKYRQAYEKYGDLMSENVSFEISDMKLDSQGRPAADWTSIEIEIERPFLDIRTMELIQKTSIVYTINKFKMR